MQSLSYLAARIKIKIETRTTEPWIYAPKTAILVARIDRCSRYLQPQRWQCVDPHGCLPGVRKRQETAWWWGPSAICLRPISTAEVVTVTYNLRLRYDEAQYDKASSRRRGMKPHPHLLTTSFSRYKFSAACSPSKQCRPLSNAPFRGLCIESIMKSDNYCRCGQHSYYQLRCSRE